MRSRAGGRAATPLLIALFMPRSESARFLLFRGLLPKVRLLWLIDSLAVGGAESLILPFAQQLIDTRFVLTVCALQSIEGSEIERQLRDQGKIGRAHV